jgi:hypothetical protein
MCDFKGLAGDCGKRNPPGVRAKLYIIPASELTDHPRSLKEMTPATTTQGATKLLNEAFAYVATSGLGYWREIDILVDTGSTEHATEGEIGNLSIRNSLNFVINGTAEKESELADQLLNCCLVAAIQLRAEPLHYKIFGRYDDPAHIVEISGGSGVKVGDRNALVFKIQDSTGDMPSLYPVATGLELTPNT